MLLSLSVDVDEIPSYAAIHGVPQTDLRRIVFEKALPRLVDWARQRDLRVTWFLVGGDLEAAENAEAVARLARAGDELGCHSFSHPYDLTRRPFVEIQQEVERGINIIERITSSKVSGFRAPGYVVTDTLLDLLRESGLIYDSSVFPCPAYYALKAATIARIAARGRKSRSIVDVPEVLRAPTHPYRVGRPYWHRGSGIWGIPIQVTKRARLPFIGTALTLAGPVGARLLAHGVLGEPLVNLELHGIDVVDTDDGLAQLAKHQLDLKIPWSRKLDAIDAAVSVLLQAGYASVRMDELAARARAAV